MSERDRHKPERDVIHVRGREGKPTADKDLFRMMATVQRLVAFVSRLMAAATMGLLGRGLFVLCVVMETDVICSWL